MVNGPGMVNGSGMKVEKLGFELVSIRDAIISGNGFTYHSTTVVLEYN